MSPTQRKILDALDNQDADFGYLSFNSIAERSGVDRKLVRRAVRALARQGLAQYGRGLWTEDGRPRGSGYAITKAGVTALEAA